MDSSLQLPPMSVGEQLKKKFLELNVFSTLLDLFFEFPWNNFLHSSVYDIIHQVLMGVVDKGLNRELVVSLFRDAKLAHRILEGQQCSDAECAKPKGVRLGYMGHLTLMSEDVINALERFPSDLSSAINQHVPQPGWDEYVQGRYQETRQQDNRLLGGGKPVLSEDPARGVRWKVDEEEAATAASKGESSGEGTFRRTTSSRPTRENSADFGPPDSPTEEDTPESAPQFARYLAQEMNSSDRFGSSGSDDDDEDGGWLTQSTFTLQAPPLSARHDSPSQGGSGFEDAFNPLTRQDHNLASDPFASDEDDFGQFSGASSATFPSSVSREDLDFDSSFDSFGDFGDFHGARDEGASTPTGSWTFEDSFVPAEKDSLEGSPLPKSKDLPTTAKRDSEPHK
jgi:serine/threonine-protein phosphatase 6 regulatory subunit 3